MQRNGKSGTGATRKERLLRAKMKKKQQDDDAAATGVVAVATYEDILQMSDLSEASLLDNLRWRYEKESIYTYVGPILIAINPYKPLDAMYSEAKMTEYYGKTMGSLPPHVFALADHAYTQLIQGGALDPANQSIIISGESGAGKTETTKIIMQYLARATSYHKVTTGDAELLQQTQQQTPATVSRALGKLEERVLESNPLLESFGNAKTLRNDNSSRFGKFIEIQFDHHGKIVGAEIMNFLLEKTRIVSQSIGERNYHIFYQLLAGADDDLRAKLQLTTPHDYEYLRKSQCFTIQSCNDAHEFETTKHCMATIGITPERQERVFDLLAAVLHLGNLNFRLENEVCVPADAAAIDGLRHVAALLQVSEDALHRALLTRQLFVGGKVIVQQQNVDQVRDKRDALAKAVYSSLFLWLVSELNRTISRPHDKWGFIGVLDIYGFEKFDWNTFEQLCINYANEKLQRHFNQHMLEVEQDEYTKEGIDWQHIEFHDNQQCLDLIEAKPSGKPGIFISLDDVWRLKGDEANRKFVAILHQTFGRDPNGSQSTTKTQHEWYIHPKVDASLTFGIKHYAGDVLYDASGFNDKNNETLNDDMKELIKLSQSEWVKSIFDLNVQSMEMMMPGNNTKRPADRESRRPTLETANPNGGGKSRNLREVSVGAQFRYQLHELMAKISLANPRYVRCIKPNEHKRSGELHDADCARQLKYSGMMEAIQIRQRGFALREDHDVFFYDYQSLAPAAETIGELVEEISEMLGAGKDQWQVGKTKVFLKRTVALKLRKLEVLRCKAAARTLQKWCRNRQLLLATVRVQTKVRQYLAKCALHRRRLAGRRILGILKVRVAVVRFAVRLSMHRTRVAACIVIQKRMRGVLIRNQKLLNPFEGLGPVELDARIAAIEAAIADAAQSKQFDLCALLQKDLEKVVVARQNVRTAKELDAAIDALGKEMETAALNKQFALCADLQKQLEALVDVRKSVQEDLNELDAAELDARIQKMEQTMNEAMDARDFERCSALQNDLDALVAARKLQQTPAELDAAIASLNEEIALCMQRKQFDKCAAVQKDIDALKQRRAAMGPATVVAPPVAAAPAPAVQAPAFSVEVPGGPVSAPAVLAGNRTVPLASPTRAAGVVAARPSVVGHGNAPAAAVRPTVAAAPSVVRPTAAAAAAVKATPAYAKQQSSFDQRPPSFEQRPRSGSNSSAVSTQSFARSTISMASTLSKATKKSQDPSRTVARLRPAKALTVLEDLTIHEAARMMKAHRAAAVLVIDASGALVGILTDTDTARRVVAKGLDTKTTRIASVMTPNPSCVTLDDSAVDALDTMLSGRFRHLPVVSSRVNGTVVGLLNVAKCIHDAIRRIESSSTTLQAELGQNNNSQSNALLRGMLEKMLSPSLADVLALPNETHAPLVRFDDLIIDVTRSIAESKKPALVVSDANELIGIFTPKDLLHRVVAMDLDPLTTTVGAVMTANPESAPPETTVLDAFHIMHDGKFLNLPVVSPSTGEIFGIADVLSISVASFGQGEARDVNQFFTAALDLHQSASMDDDTASVSSMSVTSKARQRHKDRDVDVPVRPVSSLRPSAAVTILEDATVFDAALLMKQKRSDALLVIDASGALVGILTDTDICRRVLALDKEASSTHVADVMTKNIQYVAPDDSAIDAMLTMQEGHFRHLPVVSRDGTVAGVLNIGKCIYDVSKRLEHATQSTEQLQASFAKTGGGTNHTMMQLLAPMLQKLASPTLETLLEKELRTGAATAPRLPTGTSVSVVAKAMATTRKAALIVDAFASDKLVGLFSPYELVMRVIAMDLDPQTTLIDDVMEIDPEVATPRTTVLDALHIMHDSQSLNLPVVIENSASIIAGLVDVLSLSYGTIDAIYGGDREQMQEFWNTALQLDHQPVHANASSSSNVLAAAASSRQRTTLQSAAAERERSRTVAQLRPTKVLTISASATVSDLAHSMGRSHADCVLVVSDDGLLAGIITDTDLTRRVVSENKSLETTLVGDVMTRNPTFVSTTDPAITALSSMLEGKFRHLPVVDASGSVVGILNIGKCLYDAIKKMEKTEASSAALRQTLEKKSSGIGGGSRNSGMLSQFLGPMVGKIFSPDVKSVLDDEHIDPPRVQPYTSVYEVAKLMAATKKAALVVSNKGQYFGLFTPNDLLEKVLAKNKPVHTTAVCDVMQEDAATIFGSTSVIDAMHTMHDQKTLYLTVLASEASMQAIGLVDVLSLSYGSFAKGSPSDWKAFWNASFDAATTHDDDDDTSSVHSFKSSFSTNRIGGSSVVGKKPSAAATGDSRPVSKLRPSKAVTILETFSVADAAKEMGLTHTDAALVISRDGVLRGILTDTDVTRRVVALGNDPFAINVCDAMTPNPKFVDESDSAMDAMFLMLDGKFRHLPVVDAHGMVAGMLRIQKCLYDAITRLEKAQQTSSGQLRENLEKQLLATGLGASLANNQTALQNLVGPMVEKLLSPTLETILQSDELPPLVYANETVVEVARQMSRVRKAALIVEDTAAGGKRLIGVFTPKDLLLRVVGAGLDAATTSVSVVMTPNPETAAPTTSLVDALHVMHEQKFLHLPVVEEATKTILGMVDVLSLCYGTFAKGSSGSNGDASDWKSFWDVSLALTRDDDDRSDAGSVSFSVAESKASRRPQQSLSQYRGRSRSRTASSAGSIARRESESSALRPVSKLRPRQVTRINEFITVAEAAKRMRHARVEAVVVTTEDGELRGILTDTDITRRVLAKEIDPETCSVASVMTANPSCVRSDDPAIEAITKMLEGRFKHLPVVGTDGVIQGMLDISKCLYDAITCMERVQQSTEAAATDFSRDLGNGSSLHRLLGPMMEKMVRPTVAVALEGEPRPPIVQLSTTVSAAAKMMATTKKAAIVVNGSDIVGMVTPKDLLRKLVAKGLTAEITAVEDVMTVDPESVLPSSRILDGLRLMHDAGQLFMPVLTETGDVYGMADVLCLSYGQFTNSGSAGGGDWRQFWQTAMNLQDEAGDMYDADETNSVGTIEDFERSEYRGAAGLRNAGPYATAAAYAELGESVSVISAAHTTATSAMALNMNDDTFIFKVSDRTQGHYHRILCRYDSIAVLFDHVRAKMSADASDELRLKYEDDDGDLAVLTTDESLIEAVGMAKRAGWKRIVLLVDVVKSAAGSDVSAGGTSKKKKKDAAAAAAAAPATNPTSSNSPASSAKSTPTAATGKTRQRKLTKVEEDIESDSDKAKSDHDDDSEDEDSDDEAAKARAKKAAAAAARAKKSKKKAVRAAAVAEDASSSNVVVLAGVATVLLVAGVGVLFFLKSKNK